MNDFISKMSQMLEDFYWQELLGLDENNEPRSNGLSRIRGIFDEVVEFSFWSHRPKQFTPMEFNKMWDSFTTDQKINYVLILIS